MFKQKIIQLQFVIADISLQQISHLFATFKTYKLIVTK